MVVLPDSQWRPAVTVPPDETHSYPNVAVTLVPQHFEYLTVIVVAAFEEVLHHPNDRVPLERLFDPEPT